MLVWVFLVIAVVLMATSVTTAALAWKDPQKRGRYIRISIVAAVFTVVSLVVGSTLGYKSTSYFANDYVQDMGEDTFLETLVTSTSK